ncbi:hypothetical protein AALB16_02660 [Lachnospiraceae bacterium 62-35]
MQSYVEYPQNNFDDVNIILADYMDLAFEKIKKYHALYNDIDERYQTGKANYIDGTKKDFIRFIALDS